MSRRRCGPLWLEREPAFRTDRSGPAESGWGRPGCRSGYPTGLPTSALGSALRLGPTSRIRQWHAGSAEAVFHRGSSDLAPLGNVFWLEDLSVRTPSQGFPQWHVVACSPHTAAAQRRIRLEAPPASHHSERDMRL